MRIFEDGGNGRKAVAKMSFPQTKQAAAIMDCIGRLIPQEGVDYDVEVVFKGSYNPSVSMNIVALTDKGEFWKKYVMEMIRKYPPTVENPDQALSDELRDDKEDREDKEEKEGK